MTPLYVDNSTLRTLAACDMAAWTRYGMHRTTIESRKELMSGSAAAEGFAAFRRAGLDPAAGIAAFDAAYMDWSNKHVPRGDRLEWENCRNIMWQYFLGNTADKPQRFTPHPDKIELAFELPLSDEGDVVLTGRIDALGTWESGDMIVEDDKTTGSLSDYWAKKWRTDSGQSGYVWAARQLGYNVIGTVINGVEFKKLPSDPSRKCKDHKVSYAECGMRHAKWGFYGPYPRDPGWLEEWRLDAIRLARKFRDLLADAPDLSFAQQLPMTGTFNGHCGFCEFVDTCLSGRSPVLMEANLVESVWDPRKVSVL